jgi:hypothetical protein
VLPSNAGQGARNVTFKDMPPSFAEILEELNRHKAQLGGTRKFNGQPELGTKVKKEEFLSGYTDFEYVYLTVLGFGKLADIVDQVVETNNFQSYRDNPGVQLLERSCGMTMHADRPGANGLLRVAPSSLLEAFSLARQWQGDNNGQTNGGWSLTFFKDAFDRTADPCLEGRMGRLLEYIERARRGVDAQSGQLPPWEDVSLNFRAGADAEAIVGEYLRVFAHECIWRWAQEHKVKYDDAKSMRERGESMSGQESKSSFSALYNAAAFTEYLRKQSAIIPEGGSMRWECQVNESMWAPFEDVANEVIEAARAREASRCELVIGKYSYSIDLTVPHQKNNQTGKIRPVRAVPSDTAKRKNAVTREEVESITKKLVELHTLPAAADELLPSEEADTTTGNPSSSSSLPGEVGGLSSPERSHSSRGS